MRDDQRRRRATDITGGLEARTVERRRRASFSNWVRRRSRLGAVNGGVRVSAAGICEGDRERDAGSTAASTSTGLKFESQRQARKRHFEGVLNGGGTLITATTVNGGIRVGCGERRPTPMRRRRAEAAERRAP